MTDAQKDWRTFLVLAGIFSAFLVGWFVGTHQQRGISSAALRTVSAPVPEEASGRPLSRPLPEVVEESLAFDCADPLTIAAALQDAEVFRNSARAALDDQRFIVHTTEAIHARVRAVECLWYWSR